MGKRGPWHGMHMKVKRQFDIFGSLLPLYGSQEAQVMVWWHMPLPTDPSLWSLAISMLNILELFRALNFIFFWHRSHLWTRLPSNSQSSHLSLLVLGLQRCATTHSFVFSRLVTSAATTLTRNVLLHLSDYTSVRAHRNKTFVLKDRKVGHALCKWPVLLIQTFMQKKEKRRRRIKGRMGKKHFAKWSVLFEPSKCWKVAQKMHFWSHGTRVQRTCWVAATEGTAGCSAKQIGQVHSESFCGETELEC